MRIKVIKANTNKNTLETIDKVAKKYARTGTEIVTVCPERGPFTIEDHYDEALAAVGLMEEVIKGEEEGFDGYILTCFADTGLHACKELAKVPVIGVGEASLFTACMLGYRFSIISILDRFKASMDELLNRCGLKERCASVRFTNTPVINFDRDIDNSKKALLQAARLAVVQDGAEVICLGCTGMVGFDEELEEELKVPVIDPVVAAVKVLEGLIDCGKRTSKISAFRFPEPKAVTGYPDSLKLKFGENMGSAGE